MRTKAEDPVWQSKFQEVNGLGSEHFGTLWLGATAELVGMMKEAGYADELEQSYRLRSGVARGLYRVLCTAAKHPNNLARAVQMWEAERAERIANKAMKAEL